MDALGVDWTDMVEGVCYQGAPLMSVQLLYVATGFFVGLLVGQTGMAGVHL